MDKVLEILKCSVVISIAFGVILSLGLVQSAMANQQKIDKETHCNQIAISFLKRHKQRYKKVSQTAHSFSGNVSWYGGRFNGRKTASGEIFNCNKLTAAHRSLPFFTKVLVENPKNGQSCIVKINDRGPYVRSRVLDLSRAGMHQIAPFMPGVIYADCLILDAK